jgi:predicted N-acetyltransferase YhbS
MIKIRHETSFDVAQREALLDEAFGDGRFAKTAARLREGRLPERGLAFVACADGPLVGTVRLWNIAAGRARPALLLGPLAVASAVRACGIGSALIRHALEQAQRRGHRAVLLVGDAPYYARFGFTAEMTGALSLPGPYARERLLARALVPGALEGARGLISATGRAAPQSAGVAPIAGRPGSDTTRAARAA